MRARALSMKLSGQQAVRGIGCPCHFLQIVGIGAHQVDVKRPFAFGRKTPIVEIEFQFQIRGGAAAARARLVAIAIRPASRSALLRDRPNTTSHIALRFP